MQTGHSIRVPQISDIMLYWHNSCAAPMPFLVTSVHEDGKTLDGSVLWKGSWSIMVNVPYNPRTHACWGFKEDHYTNGDLRL